MLFCIALFSRWHERARTQNIAHKLARILFCIFFFFFSSFLLILLICAYFNVYFIRTYIFIFIFIFIRHIVNIYRAFQCHHVRLEAVLIHRNRPILRVPNYQLLLVNSMRAEHHDVKYHFHGNIVVPPKFGAYNGYVCVCEYRSIKHHI